MSGRTRLLASTRAPLARQLLKGPAAYQVPQSHSTHLELLRTRDHDGFGAGSIRPHMSWHSGRPRTGLKPSASDNMMQAFLRRKRPLEADHGNDGCYDGEEIQVASGVRRDPLQEQAVPQMQNKRQRVLACVSIPKQTPLSQKQISGYFSHASNLHTDVQTPQVEHTLPNEMGRLGSIPATSARPKRTSLPRKPILECDEGSEDELADDASFQKNSSHRRKGKQRKAPVDSDFEDTNDLLDSAEDMSEGVVVLDDSSPAVSADEDSDSHKPVKKRKSAPAKKVDQAKQQQASRKPTVHCMKKFPKRKKNNKGLDPGLAPLADIDDSFADLVKRALGLDFDKALKHLNGRPLRVATMCSGTESPLLAMQMIQDCLRPSSSEQLNIKHLFSAEIVPYKQAYIERNFKPPVIFRDITEITETIDDEVPTATTAYGGKAVIPKNVHVLIVGTSCVDFSKLNNKKVNLSEEGESGQTWRAVLAYCKKTRPRIVIFENVCGAAWDEMLEQYQAIGYESAGALLDTKDFYIPQTRNRGYMVCFDKEQMTLAGVKSPGERWKSCIENMRRFASSPVSSFLLPADAIKARDTARSDDPKKEVDWSICEITQMQYRQEKRLGLARPYTHWQESGAMIVPENGSSSWFCAQVERVDDTMDCALLRKAREIDEDTMPFGLIGCITPSGLYFDSGSARALLPEELLKLQGIPLDKITLTTETPAELRSLSGNAMTSTVVGSVFAAAMIAGYKIIDFDDDVSNHHLVNQVIPSRPIASSASLSSKVLSTYEDLDVPSLLAMAERARRRCYCEVATGLASKPLQKCEDCGHTTCIACEGDPTHNYRQDHVLTQARIPPAQFESEIRSKLPLRIKLNFNPELDNLTSHHTPKIQKYIDLVRTASNDTFSFSAVRRTHCQTIIYKATHGYLELTLEGPHAEWHFFVIPAKTLPCDDWLRQSLTLPVAKCAVSRSLLGNSWRWRLPIDRTMTVNISGHGQHKPSWWARLEMPDFRDHWQWDKLTISFDDTNAKQHVEQDISGTYQYLPNCGTASESLYKRLDDNTEAAPMFLFLDPDRVGDPSKDTFVFSSNISRLEYNEVRNVIASVESKWNPWDQDEPQCTATLTVKGEWVQLPSHFESVQGAVDIEVFDKTSSVPTTLDCTQAPVIVRCTATASDYGDLVREGDRRIVPADDRVFFDEHAWLFEAIRRELATDEWHALDTADTAHVCHSCAPNRPSLRWSLKEDGKTIEAYEDAVSAGIYERAIKSRPSPIVVETQSNIATPGSVQVNLGVNLLSLAHRALARLPIDANGTKVIWKIETNAGSSGQSLSRRFQLIKTVISDVYSKDLALPIKLFPKQRLQLTWMRGQEMGLGQRCLVEESEEASLPKLGWRVEVRAQSHVLVRGGVCADHPGFGKTITSLALIHAQFLESSRAKIVEELSARQNAQSAGLIPTAATLIVCPRTLMPQWLEEIKKKLQYESGVVAIETTAALSKLTLADLESARIVVVNRAIFKSDTYAERLAAFAAIPGPAATQGRAFEEWRQFATKQVPQHLQILTESGKGALRAHVQDQYARNLSSDKFRTFVPSKRPTAAEYRAADRKPKSKTQSKGAASRTIDTTMVNCPLFEMFFWNRLIVDEFHQYEPREYAAITALKADKRWGLSGTPALDDNYDIAQIARLLNLPLRIGSDARGVMKLKNVEKYRKDMTKGERFDAMRQPISDSLNARIREVAQMLLDNFVRRNVMDFEKMEVREHLVLVSLDPDHRAVYTELSQHLNSQEMRLKKGIKAKKNESTDRDRRLYALADEVETPEEALSRTAAFFDRKDLAGSSHASGLDNLISRRENEVQQCLNTLRSDIWTAETREPETFGHWLDAHHSGDMLGDEETIMAVEEILDDLGISSATRGSKSKAAVKKSSSKARDEEDSAEEDLGEDSDNEANGKTTKSVVGKREMTSHVNTAMKKLLVSKRSLRFMQNVRRVERDAHPRTGSDASRDTLTCNNPDCQLRTTHPMDGAISALCGHLVCEACYDQRKATLKTQCPASGCSAPMRDYHVLMIQKLGDLQQTSRHTPFGAKIEAAMNLLDKIEQEGDQAVLFVQYANQLQEVKRALQARNIAASVVDDPKTAGKVIMEFQKSTTKTKAVIVLNASDETASGSNLQNANHVIFLSPLLRDTQYGYESTMAQAIGRVRRHGQEKDIHSWRIIAESTIDVDILEHRERRLDVLVELGADPITPPPSARKLDMHGEPIPERTQLVKEDGKFSLRPQSWLVRCGSDEDPEEVGKVFGKRRVGGWEDFSSLIKFSRTFTEDDE